jgi:hypothetical protein
MAIASTKTSGRLRAGHKFIEGTLNLPLLEFNLAEEIRQQCQEDSWLRDIGRSSKTLVKHRELRIVLTSTKANTRMHQHKATARISIQTITGHVRLHLPKRTKALSKLQRGQGRR